MTTVIYFNGKKIGQSESEGGATLNQEIRRLAKEYQCHTADLAAFGADEDNEIRRYLRGEDGRDKLVRRFNK